MSDLRLHGPFFGQDSLILGPDMVGDLNICGTVGLADEFDLLGRSLTWW